MRSFNPIYDQLSRIPDHNFNVYLPEVILGGNNKHICGTGHLFTDNSRLKLKIINCAPPTIEEESINFLMSGGEGSSIGELRSIEDYCYRMNAKDDHGNEYSCDFVEVEHDFDRIIYTCNFKTKISVFSSGGITNKVSNAAVVFKDKYSFATNKSGFNKNVFPTYLDAIMDLKEVWNWETEGVSMILQKSLKYLHLDIQSENLNIDNTMLKRIVDTLNFVMGIEHQYYYIVYFGDNNSFQVDITNNSKPSKNVLFTPPYRRTGSIGDEDVENVKLFNSYYRYLEKRPDTILNKLHKRIVDSGSGYYYKHGLVISTSIESILKNYYPKDQEVLSEDFLADIQQLKNYSNNLNNPMVTKRFKSFIEGLSVTGNYIPGKMLEKLESEGVIGKGSLNVWRKLRNRYAHGDDFNEELPKAVGLVMQNTTIYYELIFNLIKYEGKYTSYSVTEGNKIKTYPIDRNDESQIS